MWQKKAIWTSVPFILLWVCGHLSCVWLCKKNMSNPTFKTNYIYDVWGNCTVLDPVAQEKLSRYTQLDTHKEHTYTSHTDSWNSPERGPGKLSLPLSSYFVFPHAMGLSDPLGLWRLACGDESWMVLGGLSARYYLYSLHIPFFSVFLGTQKSFWDITYRCWCSHKLILHPVFDQIQEMTHWGFVETQKILEEFAFGIIFDKASISIPLSMSFLWVHDFVKQQVSSSHSAPREAHSLLSEKNSDWPLSFSKIRG